MFTPKIHQLYKIVDRHLFKNPAYFLFCYLERLVRSHVYLPAAVFLCIFRFFGVVTKLFVYIYSSLQCKPCSTNQKPASTALRSACTCKSGTKIVKYNGGPELTCSKCGAQEVRIFSFSGAISCLIHRPQ